MFIGLQKVSHDFRHVIPGNLNLDFPSHKGYLINQLFSRSQILIN